MEMAEDRYGRVCMFLYSWKADRYVLIVHIESIISFVICRIVYRRKQDLYQRQINVS
jgi:hypothetical protein